MKCKKKQHFIVFAFFGLLFCASFLFLLKKPKGIIKKNSQKREFASLYTQEVESRAQKMMEKARKSHHTGDYPSANKTLNQLLTTYPYTGLREEASFLLAKGLFYEDEYLQSEQIIQSLREYDMHSKWRGRALLILAKIHQQKGDKDKSFRLYNHVIQEFSEYPEVIDEARESLLSADF